MSSRRRSNPVLGILTLAIVVVLEAISVLTMMTDLPVGDVIILLLAFAFHLGAACMMSFGFWGPWDFRYANEKNWAVLGFVLVLAVPVYGLIGYSLAFAAVHFRQYMRSERAGVVQQFERYIAYDGETESILEAGMPRVISRLTDEQNAARRGQVAPLIDIIKSGSPDMKRGAIFCLGRLERATAVRILRESLTYVDRQSQFYVAGQLSRIEKELSEQIIKLRRRLELDPDDLELKVALLHSHKEYIESGLLQKAVAKYFVRKAVQLSDEVLLLAPTRVDVLLDIAELQRTEGHIDEAVDFYARVMQSDPENIAARVGLAHCYYAMRDMESLNAVMMDLDDAHAIPDELAEVAAFVAPGRPASGGLG
jgi:tetratricopeptide (TPR) repeat protein